MAYSFVNKSTNLSSTTSISFSYSVTSGTNKILIVKFAIRSGTATMSNVQYGGQAMTLDERLANATRGVTGEVWSLVNPPTGANNVTGTCSAAVAVRTFVSEYNGASQSSPKDITAEASSTTVNITPNTNDTLIVAVLSSEDGTAPTAGAGEILLHGNDDGTWGSGAEYVIKSGGAGVSHTMNFGATAAAESVIVAVAYKVVSSATVNAGVQTLTASQQAPNVSAASWYNASWSYRKKITVDNSVTVPSNFQVKVVVDTAALITAGKMQSDCDDIRITDDNGTTLLDIWIDPQTINTSTTEVWVEVPSLAVGNNFLYIYYGNASASSVSSITNTFVYGDDFSTNTVGNYTTSGGSVTVNTTNKEMTLAQQASGNTSAVPTSQTNPSSYIVEAYVSIASLATTSLAGLLGYKSTNTGGDGYVAQFGDKGSNDEVGVERYQQAHLTYTSISPSINTFYKLKGTFVSGTITARWNDTTQQASSDSTYTSGKYGMRTYNVEAKYKYFRTREYATVEPSPSLGTEESTGTPVTVNPGVQTITLAQQAPTVTAKRNVTISPSVQSITSSQPSPTVTAQRIVSVSPAVQALTVTQQAPTVSITRSATINAAVQSLTSSQQAPTITANRFVTVSASVQSITGSQQTPTITAVRNVSVNTGIQSITSSQQTPVVTPRRVIAVSPAAQTISANQITPTITVGDGATPAPQTGTFTVVNPIVTAVRNVIVSPVVQSATSNQIAPVVRISETLSQAVQTASFTQQNPTVTAIRSITVNPGVQALTASVISPTVTAVTGVTVSPSALSLTVSAPNTQVKIADTISQSVQTASFSQQAPTVTAVRNVVVTPLVQTLTANQINPTVTVGDGVLLPSQTLTFSQPSPIVSTRKDVVVSPSAQSLIATVISPNVSITNSVAVTPGTQILTASLLSPTVTTGKTVIVSPLVQSIIATQNNVIVRNGTEVEKLIYLTNGKLVWRILDNLYEPI